MLSNSVSIHRVCTVNGSPAVAGANAGSETTARWNGSTVGMPVDDELGQRAPATARAPASRVAPVTTSLASIESNAADDLAARLDAGVEPDAGTGRRLRRS